MLYLEHHIANIIYIGNLRIIIEVGEDQLGTIGTAERIAIDAIGEEDAGSFGLDRLAAVDPNIGIFGETDMNKGGIAGTEGFRNIDIHRERMAADNHLVGIGTLVGSICDEGDRIGGGNLDNAGGIACAPEIGIGAVGLENQGIAVANSVGTSYECLKTRSMDRKGKGTIGLRRVGKSGKMESVVCIGRERKDREGIGIYESVYIIIGEDERTLNVDSLPSKIDRYRSKAVV